MDKTDYNPVLTIKDVAEIFSVAEQTVYTWAKKKVIPSSKIGRVIRFDRDQIFALTSSKKNVH